MSQEGVKIERTWAITPTGVGRPDYSLGIERAVETLTRSKQAEYHTYHAWASIAPLNVGQWTILIPAGYVVLLYDVVFSASANVLLCAWVEGWWDLAYTTYAYEYEFQRLAIHSPRGLRFTDEIFLSLMNRGDINIAAFAHVHGITLLRTEYDATV